MMLGSMCWSRRMMLAVDRQIMSKIHGKIVKIIHAVKID
jgi:hypothetical protein